MAFKLVIGPNIVGPINGSQLVPGSVGATALAVGSVTTNALAAGAITGQTITGGSIIGADIETAASGNRVDISTGTRAGQQYGFVNFYTEVATDLVGSVTAFGPVDGGDRSLQLTAPAPAAATDIPVLLLTYDSSRGGSPSRIVMSATENLIPNLYTSLPIHKSDMITTLFDVIQDWTAPTLASGYTGNGNSNGTVQYRVVNILGTAYVQWAGGVNVTYSGSSPVNSGLILASPLPVTARPSGLRSISVACSTTTSVTFSMKVDASSTGTMTLVGGGTGNTPPWISLNGMQYPL